MKRSFQLISVAVLVLCVTQSASFSSLVRMSSPSSSAVTKVAVIGGGAAGLAAARVLSRNGIKPVVLEKEAYSGGVWRHIRDDSSRPMYQGLRTNLPREIMAYREKPWGGDGIGRSYVKHEEVLNYLTGYKKEFNLDQYVSYGCKVTQLTMVTDSVSPASPGLTNGNEEQWPKVTLEWEKKDSTETIRDTFDAVCICSGHYAAPSIPNVPGLKEYFKGKNIHSIEYDDPSKYKDQTVLCVGGRASGSDLAREISAFAKKVYLSDTGCPPLEDGKPLELGKIMWVPRTMCVEADSSIHFDDSCVVTPKDVDTIVFCSGYDYSFPFINDKSQIDLQFVPGERRVMPLYEQLWHARYPTLTFVGLPHSILPFPFFELQMEAVVAQLIGDATLPPLEERLDAAAKDAVVGGFKETGKVQDTHYLGNGQWDYCRRMARIAGIDNDNMEDYIATNKAIYDHAGKQRKDLFPGGPDTYRSTCYARDDANQSFVVVATEDDNASTLEIA